MNLYYVGYDVGNIWMYHPPLLKTYSGIRPTGSQVNEHILLSIDLPRIEKTKIESKRRDNNYIILLYFVNRKMKKNQKYLRYAPPSFLCVEENVSFLFRSAYIRSGFGFPSEAYFRSSIFTAATRSPTRNRATYIPLLTGSPWVSSPRHVVV